MRAVLGFTLCVTLAACGEVSAPQLDQLNGRLSLSVSQGGAGGIYFLPPLLHSTYAGTFAVDRTPVVRVCSGAPADPCSAPVAEYDMVADPGETQSHVVRMSTTDEHYHVKWVTSGIAAGAYRIFVVENGVAQAFVDVAVAGNGRRMKTVQDAEYRMINGSMPINFRMEQVQIPEEPEEEPEEPEIPVNGLRVQYFDWRQTALDFSVAPMIVDRVDPAIDFIDEAGGADVFNIGQTDRFMARWSGFVVPTASSLYTFCVVADDGVRLWVNDIQFVENWVDQDDTQRCASMWLTAGERYPLRMEFYHLSGGAAAQLYWESPRTEWEIVPSTALWPQ